MIFENVDALHSPINAAGKLQLITIGVGPNHGPNVSKYLLHPPPINLIPPTPQNSQEAGHQVAQNLLHPPEADSTQATLPPSTPSERPVEQPTRGQRIQGRSHSPLPSQLAAQLRLDVMATTLSPADGPVTRSRSHVSYIVFTRRTFGGLKLSPQFVYRHSGDSYRVPKI